MDTVQLLLRVDTAFLRGVATNMGLLLAGEVQVDDSALVFPLSREVSQDGEWRYTKEAADRCYRTCQEVGFIPPVPMRPMSRQGYRRRLRRLSPEVPESSQLWTALGYHVHNHAHFVEVSEPLAAAYHRANELLEQGRRLLRDEKVTDFAVDEGVAALSVAATYVADRIESLASADVAATVEHGSPPLQALERLLAGMELHLQLLERERQRFVARELETVAEEYRPADEQMLALLQRTPKLSYRDTPD